jgi:hypothetical protein
LRGWANVAAQPASFRATATAQLTSATMLTNDGLGCRRRRRRRV